MTKMSERWLLARPGWSTPVDRLRWGLDGLRAWVVAHRTGWRHARPVGPYGWTARRVPVIGHNGEEEFDRLALFHPRSSKAPFVQYDDTPAGRRRFMWARYRFAYDRELSRFE